MLITKIVALSFGNTIFLSKCIRNLSKKFLMSYDDNQRNKLLQLINSSEIDELNRYNISKARAAKLAAWKKMNGPISNIEDILLIDGFKSKFLERFCRSLLGDGKKVSKSMTSRKQSTFVIPSVPSTMIEKIRSCVSVRVGVSSITWSRIEISDKTDPCGVTNWDHRDVIEKKLHITDLIQRCLNIEQEIPLADCYIFENPQIAVVNAQGNANQQNINVQKAQMIAVLSYALANKNRMIDERQKIPSSFNVFYLKRFLSARLFNHFIGCERISSGDFMAKLMTNDVATATDQNGSNPRGQLQFPKDLQEMFSKTEHYQREFLSQTLLLNLAFVRLVLLKDPASIAVVTRSTKSNHEVEGKQLLKLPI